MVPLCCRFALETQFSIPPGRPAIQRLDSGVSVLKLPEHLLLDHLTLQGLFADPDRNCLVCQPRKAATELRCIKFLLA